MADLFSYADDLPGWKGRDTSRAAAVDAAETAATLREKAIPFFVAAGSTGLTAEELAERMRVPRVSIQPRVSELAKAGKLKDSGHRRLNRSSGKKAVAWVIAGGAA